VIGLSTLQLLQMNNRLDLSRLRFTPLHHLWIYFRQQWHKIKILPTPFLHTPYIFYIAKCNQIFLSQ